MTREQAKDFLVTLGVTEPTDDAISAYLNNIGSETKKANERANAYKLEADKARDLQSQLDEINNANLSEIEKANKATETANTRVAELEKQMKAMQLKADLATNGIIGDDADSLIKSLESGTFDASILGKLIADREKTAVANFEKESLKGTPNPKGAGAEDEQEPIDVINAKTLVFGNIASSQEARDYYKL